MYVYCVGMCVWCEVYVGGVCLCIRHTEIQLLSTMKTLTIFEVHEWQNMANLVFLNVFQFLFDDDTKIWPLFDICYWNEVLNIELSVICTTYQYYKKDIISQAKTSLFKYIRLHYLANAGTHSNQLRASCQMLCLAMKCMKALQLLEFVDEHP